jgi:hypothetical protein
MMAWIVVALLAVFSADAGVPSLDANATPEQSLDGGGWPEGGGPGPKP